MLRTVWESALQRLAGTLAKRMPSAWHRIPGSRSWWPWSWIEEAVSGAWQRNDDISIETGLSNPTLYACVTLIAGDVGKLRPKLVEQDDDGIWEEVDSAAFSPVIRKPNHYQSRIDFYEWWMISKLTTGNTYALKARDARNVVTALYILDPMRVQPLVAADGSVFYELDTDELSGHTEPLRVPAREIIHDVCCPLYHPLCGVSPLYAAGAAALQGLTIRSQSTTFFENGSKPGGVLTAPGDISPDTARRVETYWRDNFSGDNIGKIAVLGNGLTYEAMAVTAEQAQLVLQLKMSDEDIAKCFHMPRHKVGIGPDPSYNNIEALNQQYYSDCLQKHIEKLEICLDEGLELTKVPGRTLGVEFERDDLFQMDTATLVKTAREAIQGGASPNEVRRRWLGVGRVDGGDLPFLQQQMWPINQLAQREIPAPGPPAPPPPQLPPPETVEAEPPAKAIDLLNHARHRLEQKFITGDAA